METSRFESSSADALGASTEEMVAVFAAVSMHVDQVHAIQRRLPPKSEWLRTARIEAVEFNARIHSRERGWY